MSEQEEKTMQSAAQAAEIEAIAAEQEPPVSFEGVTPPPAAEISTETKEILQPLFTMGFGILAPNWQVSEDETEQLAGAYAMLMDKYLPTGMGAYSVEIAAIMITGAVVIPRLKVPRKDEPEAKKQSPYELKEAAA